MERQLMNAIHFIRISIGAVTISLLYLLFYPVPIRPISWKAPIFIPSQWTNTIAFQNTVRWETPDGIGPEDVDADASEKIYAGLKDGRIIRWSTAQTAPKTVANTGGRPLGLHWDHSDRLLIADAYKGLLRMSPDGQIETLATRCGNRKLNFTEDLEILNSGVIYFSEASSRFDLHQWKRDLLEGAPNGRLCRWQEGDTIATEVLSNLYFANGVAIDPEEQFVLINETGRFRVLRYWLQGAKKGELEILVDNLPGFVDGISRGDNGIFWIAIPSPRNLFLDSLSSYPWARKIIDRLPPALKPAPEKTARVIGINKEGQVIYNIWDPIGEKASVVTSVQERNGYLYLGSYTDNAVVMFPSPNILK